MSKNYIKYYPAASNGDTSLISLKDETKIIIDIYVTEDSEDENENSKFDIKHDLIYEELKTDGEISYTDVFILSHPDNDHCLGFSKTFYVGKPDDMKKEDELIRIDELWFTPRIFNEYKKDLSDDAVTFRDEAKRRIDLYKTDKEEAQKPGNRVRIIGYSDNKELEGLEDRIVTPTSLISNFNGTDQEEFSFFIHAPFNVDTDDEDVDRNDTSVVVQARFDVEGVENAGLAFFAGDASWKVWERIKEESNDEGLEWDLFMAPHHCSWTFFNNTTEEGKKEAKQSSLDVLRKKRNEGSKLIASCKPIKDNDDDPPSNLAKEEYIKEVGENNFLVTSEHPNEESPKPIIFEITKNGPAKPPSGKIKDASAAAGGILGSTVNVGG